VQLTVIGCSPAWPNAGGAQSGYLVEGEGRLLLDCGPGVLARLRKVDGGWPRVDAVAITHFHLDHWGDLVPWIFGASFGPGREIPAPELWLPPGGRDKLQHLACTLAALSRRLLPELKPELDVLQCSHVRKEGVRLEHHAYVPFVGRQPGHILAAEHDTAAVGFLKPRHQAEGGGLATARWAE